MATIVAIHVRPLDNRSMQRHLILCGPLNSRRVEYINKAVSRFNVIRALNYHPAFHILAARWCFASYMSDMVDAIERRFFAKPATNGDDWSELISNWREVYWNVDGPN